MNLSIELIDKKPKKRQVMGKIQIGEFEEYFDSPLDWWNIDDYERQWRDALKRLKDHDKSCFVVAINDPKRRRFIEWWPLYKFNNKIHVQNHIIISDIYKERVGDKSFTLENCYDFIPEYEAYGEDGNKISEWVIDWNEDD